jgi:hypothetical protein
MKKTLICFFILASLLPVSGCGYTTSSALPSNLRTIFIPAFKNNITYTTQRASGSENYFPLMEVKVRNAIEERFLFDGKLRLAKTAEEADLVLKGELVGYQKDPLRFTAEDEDKVQEYRIRILVDLVLRDKDEEQPLWEEKGFAGEATYFITGANATSESSAIENATADLARRVVERTIENW